MKKLFNTLAMLICFSMLAAVPKWIIGIKIPDGVRDGNFDSIRSYTYSIAQQGFEVYYYNDQYIIAGSELSEYPGAKLLCNNNGMQLYLVKTAIQKSQKELSERAEILWDMGTQLLIRSALSEKDLRSQIDQKFIPLDFIPLLLSKQNKRFLSSGNPRNTFDDLITHVSADSIMGYMQSLQDFQTRYAFANNHTAIANWVQAQFLRFGITDTSFYGFPWAATTQYNVVATIPGTMYPDTYILVGAHHDSTCDSDPDVYAPGADDNASGVAAILEMARVMMATGFQPKCSIRFITFAAEEFGNWGSRSYARYAYKNHMDVRLMINHDMIANTYPDVSELRVRLMPYDGFLQYTDYAAALTAQYTPLIPEFGELNFSYSDSNSFWQRDYPVIYFCEYNTSSYYHSDWDVTGNIDPEYCAKVVRASTIVTASYANLPSEPANFEAIDLGTGRELQLNWQGVNDPNFDHYRIYWGVEPGVYPFSQDSITPNYMLSGLVENQTYYIAVCTVDDAYKESTRAYLSATPRLVPITPLNFSDSPNINSINLSWSPNEELDLAGYRIFRSLDPSFSGDMIAELSPHTTSYCDNGLEGLPDYYYYRLAAYDTSNYQSGLTSVLKSRPVSLNMGILVIDETQNNSGINPFEPNDEMVDEFYELALQNFTSISTIDLATTDSPLRLADIGIYSSILWHGNDFNDVAYPYDIKAVLRQYVELGGNILFSIYKPGLAFEHNLVYPQFFESNRFINNVLGIGGVDYDNNARLKYALPLLDSYPPLEVDCSKTPEDFWGHIYQVESLFPDGEALALYAYGSDYPTAIPQGSMNGEIVGVYNHFEQGQTITLSFPLYSMQIATVRQLMNRVFGIQFHEPVAAYDPGLAPISGLKLLSCYPNPFNGICSIPIKTSDLVNPIRVDVYNIKGQLVRSLHSSFLSQTEQILQWDNRDNNGNSVASEIYCLRAKQNGLVCTQKIILIK